MIAEIFRSTHIDEVMFNDLECIPRDTFADNDNIKFYTVPKNVKIINNDAFVNSNLESIVLPENLEVIGYRAFKNCVNLIRVDVPNNVREICTQAFANSGIIEANLPDNLDYLQSKAFEGCDRLQKVSIGRYIKHIGFDIFAGCSNLRSIIFRGYKDDWEKIPKEDWIYELSDSVKENCKIHCVDDDIEL